MGLMASDSGSGQTFDPLKEGLHQGICYAVYDLGTEHSERFNKDIHKVIIIWELPDERIDIEKDGIEKNLPRAISKRYTLSLHEKATLRKDLETWRGRAFTNEELMGFDLTKLLGINCNLQVIHTHKDDRTYANISTVIPLTDGQEKKQPENPISYFSFEDEMEIPNETPGWIQDIIKTSDEWKMQMHTNPENYYTDDPGFNEKAPF